MIRIDLKADQAKALMDLLPREAKKALYRATLKTTEQTASQAAKLIAKETRTGYRALLRGMRVKLPRKNATVIRGEILARTGDFIPLAGSPTRIRWIQKVPRNYKQKRTVRSYQVISVKFFGKASFKEIPGAFRAELIGGNQGEIAEQRKAAKKTGAAIRGRRRKALLMRRGEKRLGVRELLTNQPDLAMYLLGHEKTIQSYAQKTLDTKLKDEIRFRQIRQESKK